MDFLQLKYLKTKYHFDLPKNEVILKNLYDFIEENEIAFHELCYPEYIRKILTENDPNHKNDHIRVFLSNYDEWIIINSPYKHTPKEYFIEHGWEEIVPLYYEECYTFVKKIMKKKRKQIPQGQFNLNQFVFSDADFCPVKEIHQANIIKEFIDSYIYNSKQCSYLLRNLSNVYVLIANIDSEELTKENECKWDSFLDSDQMDLLKTNGKYIIGYIGIGEKSYDYHLIEFINTRVKGFNIAKYMIARYEREHHVLLLPEQIIESTVEYWKNHFDIQNVEEITDIIESVNHSLNWNQLISYIKYKK